MPPGDEEERRDEHEDQNFRDAKLATADVQVRSSKKDAKTLSDTHLQLRRKMPKLPTDQSC